MRRAFLKRLGLGATGLTMAAVASSCTSGPIGPAGPVGPAGPTGPGGSTGPPSGSPGFASAVSVLEYGAKCDGLTDDSRAVQAALDSGAGAVDFPRNSITVIGAALLIPSNMQVRGGGWSSVVKTKDGADCVLFDCARGSNIIISDLALDGNRENQPGVALPMGIRADDVNGLIVKHCHIARTRHAGLYTRNTARNVLVEGCTFYDVSEPVMAKPAIYLTGLSGDSYGIRLVGNHFENCHQALSIRGSGSGTPTPPACHNILVSGNTIRDCAISISFSSTERLSIIGNQFFNDGTVRTPIGGFVSDQGEGNRSLIVSGNMFHSAAGVAAVELQNGITDVVVADNVVQGGSAATIAINNGSTRIRISGNIVKEPGTYFLTTDGTISYLSITDNVIWKDSGYGGSIYLWDGCHHVTVERNVLHCRGGLGSSIIVPGVASSSSHVNIRNNVEEGYLNVYTGGVRQLEADATFPDVSSGDVFTTNNSVRTRIARLGIVQPGKRITLIFGDSNTTLGHGVGNLRLASGLDFSGKTGDSVSMVGVEQWWYETARSLS